MKNCMPTYRAVAHIDRRQVEQGPHKLRARSQNMPHIDTITPHADTTPHTDTTKPHGDTPSVHTDVKSHSDVPKAHKDTIVHIDVPGGGHTDTTVGGRHTDVLPK
jgi:hypothetical protein